MDKTEPIFHHQPEEPVVITPPPRREETEGVVLARMMDLMLEEQRKGRRMKALFRGFIAVYLMILLPLIYVRYWPEMESMELATGKKHTAVVALEGAIMPDTPVSAEFVLKGLRKAFEDKHTQGVILRINSPGGSPVQAGIIFDEARRLKNLHPTIPFYAVLEDLCASGGYYVAVAAEEIYADKATLVGSIGVVMRTFGMEGTLQILGVENRMLTAGEHKGFLDPFSPVNEVEKAHAQTLLDRIHTQFIGTVKEGRGNRLKAPDHQLFNGLIWTGDEALALGLVDGLGSVAWVAREKIKTEKIKEFTHEEDWLTRLSERMATSLGNRILFSGQMPLLP